MGRKNKEMNWKSLFKGMNLRGIYALCFSFSLVVLSCSSPERESENLEVFSEVGEPIIGPTEDPIPSAPMAEPLEEPQNIAPEELSKHEEGTEEVIEGKIVLGQTLLSTEGNQTSPIISNLPAHDPTSGYEQLSYSSLTNFEYEIDWENDGFAFDFSAFAARVPKEIRKLSNQKVAIEGFMVPTVVDEENLVKELLLMPDQLSCCFGQAPEANGWVVVRSQKGVEVSMDRVIRILGTLTVEERWDEEFFVGLYHLECDQLIDSSP
jgi:hypothetical protein